MSFLLGQDILSIYSISYNLITTEPVSKKSNSRFISSNISYLQLKLLPASESFSDFSCKRQNSF